MQDHPQQETHDEQRDDRNDHHHEFMEVRDILHMIGGRFHVPHLGVDCGAALSGFGPTGRGETGSRS